MHIHFWRPWQRDLLSGRHIPNSQPISSPCQVSSIAAGYNSGRPVSRRFQPRERPLCAARWPFEDAGLPLIVNARHPPAIAAEDDMLNFGSAGKLSRKFSRSYVPYLQAIGGTVTTGGTGS